MRIFTLIAFAISLLVCSANAWAQSNKAPSASSSTITTSPADFSEDQTFAQFQRMTTGMKPPKATHAPDPRFPDLPPDAEPHGTVVMLVGVNAKGQVAAVRVLRSDEKAFEQSAVDTVKKWKFKPAEKGGQRVPVQVTVEMRFQR